MYLAMHPDRLCTVEEIATSYGISRNHLMKLAYELGKAGYVKTVRGRSGGLALGRAPEAINIGELMRHTEDDFVLVECFDPGRNSCALSPACRLRSVLSQALLSYLAVLDSYTLADLVAQPDDLRRLLGGDGKPLPTRAASEAAAEAGLRSAKSSG